MLAVFCILLAYLLGSIPFGYLLVRWRTGSDIRQAGSGNIGATNVFRTKGRGIGVATLLLDMAKAVLAVFLTARLTDHSAAYMSAAAVAVVAGHVFPIFLLFRGGKAVASMAGAFLLIAPLAIAAVAVVFVVVVWRARFISLGSVVSALLFPLAVWIIERPHEWPPVVASVICAALVMWRHKENIARLRAGKENAFTLSRGSQGQSASARGTGGAHV